MSNATSDCPCVWLVHRPMNDSVALPVFVDIAVGRSKRSQCRMKKVQELFGHWVWEAEGFDQHLLDKEVDENGQLKICVEVSMRQWLQDKKQQVAHAALVESQPDSPMSTYTVFKPLVSSTNPFVAGDVQSPVVTPRRGKWAKFGTEDDEEEVKEEQYVNPFRK